VTTWPSFAGQLYVLNAVEAAAEEDELVVVVVEVVVVVVVIRADELDEEVVVVVVVVLDNVAPASANRIPARILLSLAVLVV
jgi:hypothetical protein